MPSTFTSSDWLSGISQISVETTDYLGIKSQDVIYFSFTKKKWHFPLFYKRSLVYGAHAREHWNKMVRETEYLEKRVKKVLL